MSNLPITAPIPTTRTAESPTSPAPAGLFEVFVEPFYLSMMRLNALRADQALLERAARAATVLSVPDVLHLLRGGAWREEVMGAWYALSRPGDAAVRAAVLDVLATQCAGDLTSAPLTTAAVVLAGRDAVGAVETFMNRVPRAELADNARGFCAAAAEFARGHGSRAMPRPTEADRDHLGGMLHIAARFVAPAANWALPGTQS